MSKGKFVCNQARRAYQDRPSECNQHPSILQYKRTSRPWCCRQLHSDTVIIKRESTARVIKIGHCQLLVCESYYKWHPLHVLYLTLILAVLPPHARRALLLTLENKIRCIHFLKRGKNIKLLVRERERERERLLTYLIAAVARQTEAWAVDVIAECVIVTGATQRAIFSPRAFRARIGTDIALRRRRRKKNTHIHKESPLTTVNVDPFTRQFV